jgi:sortase A
MLTYLPVIALEMKNERPETKNIELAQVWLTEQEQFGIEIPSLDLKEKVIPNVDLGDKDGYMAALKKGVAHGSGSGFPGIESQVNRTIYLFAHSTDFDWNVSRYNALFYGLKDLEKGNEIKLTFWGEEYRYRVEEVKKLAAEETSFLEPQIEEEKLVLSTCWPPGTTWKRLVVIAEKSD